VSGLVSDFFNPYPSIDASTIDAYFYPNHSKNEAQNTKNNDVKQPEIAIKTGYTSKQNTLEIPKLSLSVPIIFSKSAEKSALMNDLNKGVVFYPGSVYPGQVGQMIILGHSAPPGWPQIKYDWVFTDINELKAGDIIFIDLNGKQYKYVVKKITIIQRGADVPQDASVSSNNVLTLISCWPPGKDYQRITVTAELVNN